MGGRIAVALDNVIPPIPDPPTTKYIRHVRIQSERLTKFWGRPMYLGAHVLVPEGWDAHPNARYPLVINHGHFPYAFDGFREEPPDPNLPCAYTVVNLYEDANAHYVGGPWRRVPRPGLRDYLGHVSTLLEDMNRLELVLATRGRSGGQWDICQAV